MQTIQEPTCQIPVVDNAEVLVNGSGPAALATMRAVSEVFLVDRFTPNCVDRA
ncbi:hypothetical protein [Ruegeria lacuscaerulensis]|uniref:hypothetical protein n=1 Tax=Ruegeria lacuscaerulensis TaxID=55218 RepID=UPI00147FE7B3|nr:hypothetical protein [Ruegeria lacuscaerulensis]